MSPSFCHPSGTLAKCGFRFNFRIPFQVTPGLHSGPQSWSVDQCPETPPEHPESSVPDAMRKSVVTRNYPPNNSRGYLQLDPRLSSVWPRCCLEAGDTAARISLLGKNWPCLVRGLLFVIDHSHSTSPEGCETGRDPRIDRLGAVLARISPINAPGIRALIRSDTAMTARTPRPMTSVIGFASFTCPARIATRWSIGPSGEGSPRTPGNWEMKMCAEMPARKPIVTGIERRSAIQPRRKIVPRRARDRP
jgi:hypothetical protein